MSDTKRINPKTFKEEKERSHIRRKIREARRDIERKKDTESFLWEPDDKYTLDN